MRLVVFSLIAIAASVGAAAAQSYGTRNSGFGSGYGTGSNPNSHYVSPYTRNDGSFVGGHYQTNPNPTVLDNYGTRGNVNPYTGQTGRRNPW